MPINVDGTTNSYSVMTNGIECNENMNGSASCTGSLIEEEQFVEENCMDCPSEEIIIEEEPIIESEYIATLPAQPLHLTHMLDCSQTVAPSYCYPGHYMFGPPMMNVDGWYYYFLHLLI